MIKRIVTSCSDNTILLVRPANILRLKSIHACGWRKTYQYLRAMRNNKRFYIKLERRMYYLTHKFN